MAVSPLTTTFLVSIRLGTVLLFSPIEAFRLVPIHARLILVLMLSLLISNQLLSHTVDPNELSLLLQGLAEFSNGLILSLSIYAAFAIFQIAGQLIDTQIGLNALALFNPVDHSHEPLSSRLLLMLAVLFFFAINGHHQLLNGLLVSFTVITPGKFALFDGFVPVIQQCSFMFSFAFMLASPIIIGLLIIDVSSALLTRNMPQVSTYFLALPIKIMLGLFILGLLLTVVNPVMEDAFQLCFQSWKRVLS